MDCMKIESHALGETEVLYQTEVAVRHFLRSPLLDSTRICQNITGDFFSEEN